MRLHPAGIPECTHISICLKLAYLSVNLVNLSLNLLHVYLCVEMHQQHTTGDNPARLAPARPDGGAAGRRERSLGA